MYVHAYVLGYVRWARQGFGPGEVPERLGGRLRYHIGRRGLAAGVSGERGRIGRVQVKADPWPHRGGPANQLAAGRARCRCAMPDAARLRPGGGSAGRGSVIIWGDCEARAGRAGEGLGLNAGDPPTRLSRLEVGSGGLREIGGSRKSSGLEAT